MRKLIVALLVALLMAGCGDSEDSPNSDHNKSATQPAVVDKWTEWEANPEPYGGLEVLTKIRDAKESNAGGLGLNNNQITDLTPLAGLTELTVLDLGINKITDVTPLAGLTKLTGLWLPSNKITDVTPLAGLTKLKKLNLIINRITDVTPLAGLTNLEELNLSLQGGFPKKTIPEDQIEILRKALPNCEIKF